jgi:hypothetical protein
LLRLVSGAGDDATALFQVISRRQLRGSVLLTTRWGIALWEQVFDHPVVATTMRDRQLHCTTALTTEGESYPVSEVAGVAGAGQETAESVSRPTDCAQSPSSCPAPPQGRAMPFAEI